jgi:hypothetical protein
MLGGMTPAGYVLAQVNVGRLLDHRLPDHRRAVMPPPSRSR